MILPPSSLDQELRIQLFPTLMDERAGFDGQPPTFAPLLARSWDWSPDHKDLTFHLRDAVWSDGMPVTAADVRWTWQAQTNPQVGWYEAPVKAEISDVVIVDPRTVRFHFRRAYARQMFDANEGGILPRHAWSLMPFSQWRQQADWFKQHQHLVVSGPFTVASWSSQKDIVLRRNALYFGFDRRRASIEYAVIRVVSDPAGIVPQLTSGTLDFTPSIAPQLVRQVQANPDLRLVIYPPRTWVAITWNCTRAPFSSSEIRRALALLLDRQKIVGTLLGQYGRVCVSPILHFSWAHDGGLAPWPQQRTEALRILAAHGWSIKDRRLLDRHGRPLQFELLSTASSQQHKDAATMIQRQFREAGIDVALRQNEYNSLNSVLEKGDFDAAILGTTMDTSLDLRIRFHSAFIGATNYARFADPAVDRLIDEANAQPDILKARRYLDLIQRELYRQQPYTYLWEANRLAVANRRVSGIESETLYTLSSLKDWRLDHPLP